MKWSGNVDESTRQKIEVLCEQFERYIKDTHGERHSSDRNVIRQWNNFKAVIEENPANIEALKLYVDQMSSAKEQESHTASQLLLKSKSNPALTLKVRHNIITNTSTGQKPGIDKAGLKKCTRLLMDAMKRNTLEMNMQD